MSDEEDPQEEPSMEEILASIKRIISEDTEDEEQAPEPEEEVEEETSPQSQQVSEHEAEPEPEPEEEFDGGKDGEDILELTEVVEEPYVPHVGDPVEIVSNDTGSRAGASFSELSALMVAGYSGSSNTLEGLVRELLKPTLKTYLDENLPRIVEDMVEREIARISRKK